MVELASSESRLSPLDKQRRKIRQLLAYQRLGHTRIVRKLSRTDAPGRVYPTSALARANKARM